MKTTKTIDVLRCDFCDRDTLVEYEEDFNPCISCGKDMCRECCRANVSILLKQPQAPNYSPANPVCGECAPKTVDALRRLGLKVDAPESYLVNHELNPLFPNAA